MMIVTLVIGFLLVSLAAVAEAIMDKVQFHYEKSIFSHEKYKQEFWNPSKSWVNKWKADHKTEKFPGSSTIFVFTTDAWHLFKFFRNTFLFVGLPLLTMSQMNVVIAVVLGRVLYGIFFTIFFDKFLVK